jgi:outer membrane immunogenic protein
MEKLLLAGAVFAVLIPSRAIAADAAARVDKAVAAPVFSWTGFYIGGNVGGAFLQSDWSNIDPPGNGTIDANIRRSGLIGGAQLGFNYQHEGLVLGVEGNYSRANLDETQIGCYATALPTLQPLTCNTQADRFAAVVVRAGVAWQTILLYGKIGEAWGHFSYNNGCTLCPSINYSGAETRAGRIVGGGIEYAILHNFTVKVEYDYLDFGKATLPFFGNTGDMFTQDIANRVHLIKVGANYLFGWSH